MQAVMLDKPCADVMIDESAKSDQTLNPKQVALV